MVEGADETQVKNAVETLVRVVASEFS
jgi:hypothetical protein